jgi:hypothetical protein
MNEKAIESAKNLILIVTGGIGRNIMATAVVRNLKAAYPSKRLVVVCGYPDIFLQNPHIYRVFNASNPVYFYEDFIKDSESVVLNVEPYQHPDFLYKRKHFVECWCEMLGIECDNVFPEMFYTDNELMLAEAHMAMFDKDLVMCQFEGGKIPEGKDDKSRIIARNAMYRRSLPSGVQTKIVDALNLMNYRVGVVAHENQYLPGCCDRVFYQSPRAVIALIPFTKQIICIDSFLLHGAAVFKKPAIALWAGTSPVTLGYPNHTNLRRSVCDTPECHRPNSYLFDITPTGYAWECPVNNVCCDYSDTEVMAEFSKLTEGKKGEPRRPKGQTIRPVGINPYERRDGDASKVGSRSVGTAT